MHIREFTATLECHLIDLLQKRLEELNEPDRLLISRLNRALCELGDGQSSVLSRPLYHLPSPTRPAHRVWTMSSKDPKGLEKLVSEVCKMADIPHTEKEIEEKPCDVKFSALPPSLWSVLSCANFLIEQSEADERPLARQRVSRPLSSLRFAKGFALCKSASSIATSHRSTSSLPSPVLPSVPNSDVGEGKVPNATALPEDLTPQKKLLANGHINSIDSAEVHFPLEPNVFVREMRPSSFRERSLPSESDSNATFSKTESLNVSPMPSGSCSACPSVASSIPPYPADVSFDSQDSHAALSDRTLSSCGGPSSSSTSTMAAEPQQEQYFHRFGETFLTRPIDVIALPQTDGGQQMLAISDSCGGVYITTIEGNIIEHLPIKNSSASSLAVDPTTCRLLVSVMQAKGRSIYSFDIKNRFARVEVISCPKEPKIELSRTRWITVSPRGEIFAVSGDNHKSAIWMYNRTRKGWKTLKDSRKTRYQYLCIAEDQAEYRAVVLLTCDAAQNRLLLFVVDHSGTLINEYDLTKTYRLNEHIDNPASAVVDGNGNLLVLDYASGRLWILLSGVKGIRRLKEVVFSRPLGAQQALGIAVNGDWVYVTCFNRREIVSARYLSADGLFFSQYSSALRAPQTQRRAVSLPRPARNSTRI